MKRHQPLVSPLRYPGSKATLVDWIHDFLVANDLADRQIVEPYAGSAVVSINLLARGVASSAMLFERDPLLFSFWYSAFHRPRELIHYIEQYDPTLATREKLSFLKEMDTVHDDIPLMGFAGLLFNRTSFSGVLHAGPIGGLRQTSQYDVGCRYNKTELISRVERCGLMADKVEVYFGDAIRALVDAQDCDNTRRIFYVDPPYYVQGPRLYRYHYRFSDHIQLAETLTGAKFKWMLSYDDHAAIRHLYREFCLFEPHLRYSSKVPKNETELFYTNTGKREHSDLLKLRNAQTARQKSKEQPKLPA